MDFHYVIEDPLKGLTLEDEMNIVDNLKLASQLHKEFQIDDDFFITEVDKLTQSFTMKKDAKNVLFFKYQTFRKYIKQEK